MIVESLALNADDGDCHRCQRQEVPCVDLGCYERNSVGAIVEVRLHLLVSVCVECLRGVMDAKALPVVPATCGECAHRSRENVNGDALCGKLSSRFHERLVGASHAPPDDCPLRKGAA